MDLLKAAPEQLSRFVSFLVAFAASPRATLQPYAERDPTARPALSTELLLFCGLSVGCAVLVTSVGQAIGMAEDPSSSLAVLSRLDEKILPLVVALGILAASAVWHGLTLLVGNTLGRVEPELHFKGKVLDSMNAGLAVGALYVPTLTLVVVGIRVAFTRAELPLVAVLVSGFVLAAIFLVYFVSAFSAVHRVPPARYYALFSVTVVAIMLIADWVGRW